MSFSNASVPALFAPAAIPAPLLTTFALLMVATVLALVAWALHLMQAASERREFALMLAGCMVCSAAVGLATVMVITISGPGRLEARGLGLKAMEVEHGVSLDAIVLPWDQPSTDPNARS
jgi:hypothetical protein